MFADIKIAENFSVSHTRASYIIREGLLPYFTQIIIDDLVKFKLPFSIHFDETTTVQVRKQMDLTLRYWSTKHDEVWTVFYTSLFFGHAEGETVFRNMNELIVQDNPNYPGLVDFGSCTIYTVHNAFGKGLEKYGKDIDQLCMDLYALFKYNNARREDFKEVQIEMDVEVHNFQQHTEVCWLSIGPSIKRILEQWYAICHFVSELNKDPKKVPKSINYKRVYMMLGTKKRVVTQVTLEFLNSCIRVCEQFLLLFQKSSPVVHILYDNMCDILGKLMRRFMKTWALENKYGSDLSSIDCKEFKLQLGDKELVIPDATRKALKELTPDQCKHAMLGI